MKKIEIESIIPVKTISEKVKKKNLRKFVNSSFLIHLKQKVYL